MAFDGLFIYKLIDELKDDIVNYRIDKINLANGEAFIFNLYHNKTKNNLKINLNPQLCSLHLTDDKDYSKAQNMFLLSLKKYLEKGIITDIYQHHTDRVIVIDIDFYDFIDGKISRKLIFEAMGKHANLYIVGHDGIIIDCFKKSFSLTLRQLMPKAMFEFFPSSKKAFTEYSFENFTSYSDILNKYEGLSTMICKYLVEKSLIKPHLIDVKPTKTVDNKFYFFDIFNNDKTITYNSLSELLDSIKRLENKNTNQGLNRFISSQIKRLNKKKGNLLLTLDQANKNLIYKEYGDYIYSVMYSSSIDLSSMEHMNLDTHKSLSDNAQSFYKKYQKAKRSFTHINEQIVITDNELEYFNNINNSLNYLTQKDLLDLETELNSYGYNSKQKKIKAKKDSKPNYLTINLDDATIYLGKSSLQNAYLVAKVAKPNDYWFHIKDGSGSHLILRTDHLSEKLIRLSAMLCSYYSSYKASSSIAVDYTLVRNLKKIPGKPGYELSYKNHKTIYIDIDEQIIKEYI